MRNLLNLNPGKEIREIVEEMHIAEEEVCGNCCFCSNMEESCSIYGTHVCDITHQPVEPFDDASGCKHFYT